MQVVKEQEPPKRKFASFKQKNPPQVPISSPPPLQEPAAITSQLPEWKRWPNESFVPITISLFEGGLVVLNPSGPIMEFNESETKKTKLPWEDL